MIINSTAANIKRVSFTIHTQSVQMKLCHATYLPSMSDCRAASFSTGQKKWDFTLKPCTYKHLMYNILAASESVYQCSTVSINQMICCSLMSSATQQLANTSKHEKKMVVKTGYSRLGDRVGCLGDRWLGDTRQYDIKCSQSELYVWRKIS